MACGSWLAGDRAFASFAAGSELARENPMIRASNGAPAVNLMCCKKYFFFIVFPEIAGTINYQLGPAGKAYPRL